MKHKHILISDKVKIKAYKPNQGHNNNGVAPKDRDSQAVFVASVYKAILEDSKRKRKDLNLDDDLKAKGCYMDVTVEKDTVNYDSFDNVRGPRLMNVKESAIDDNLQEATIYLPDEHDGWLENKIAEYSDETKDTEKNPKNAKLINSIDNIQAVAICRFIISDEDIECYNNLPCNVMVKFEVWLSYKDSLEILSNEVLFPKLKALGVRYSTGVLTFNNSQVLLVETSKSLLEKFPLVFEYLSQIRLFKSTSPLLDANSIEENEWVDLIQINRSTVSDPVKIGLIDSGVNTSNRLIAPFVDDGDCYKLDSLPSLRDKRKHGTLMAGLAIYGDLTDAIYSSKNIEVCSKLASYKIMQGNDEPVNKIELYGVIAEEAMSTLRGKDIKILCSAITAEGETHGQPSEWSSAIDQILYNGGNADSLMFISAGNVEETSGLAYPLFNYNAEVKDPAQSWNGITVGAYTEKVVIGDTDYDGITPFASAGGLSPYSSTSLEWDNGIIKPEIMMEGGNAIDSEGKISSMPDDLNLISTSGSPNIHIFEAMYATSAATAMAARLASHIQYQNPQLSALSIRGLMIHAGSWTDEMIRMNTDNGKLDKNSLLHTCGYGVPNEDKAVMSDDTYVTFVAEEEMIAVSQNKSKGYSAAQMHMFDLPWPKEALLGMEDEEVTLKITLSYYVDPSPGAKTRLNKYKYPSIGLRFDVNKATDSEDEFIARISHITTDDEDVSDNDTKRWNIGIKLRNNGSIISDSITDTAAVIASCNKIAVYPVSGWWNNRTYSEDKLTKIKYSLIVSLETSGAEIYNAIEIPQIVEV